MLNLYNDIVKKLEHNLSSNDYSSNKNELFGLRFFFRNYLEEHKDSENENKIIGDNDIHMIIIMIMNNKNEFILI